jgi:hypothetical protein
MDLKTVNEAEVLFQNSTKAETSPQERPPSVASETKTKPTPAEKPEESTRAFVLQQPVYSVPPEENPVENEKIVEVSQEKELQPVPAPKSVNVASAQRRNLITPQPQATPKNLPQIFTLDHLKQRALPSGKFYSSILHGEVETKVFAVSENSEHVSGYLTLIEASIAEHVEKDSKTGYKPQVGELVLARFEAAFYRAVCKEIVKEGFLVYFIDYGNTAIVNENEMKPMTKELLFNVVVHLTVLRNFPDVIDEKVERIIDAEGGKFDQLFH